MGLTAVIADDEVPARDELKFLLSDIEEIEVVAEFADGESVLEFCKEEELDLLFLDIQMPGKTGVEIAEAILNWKQQPLIVFITAYDEYAVKAFELNTVDYLLKPFGEERFQETINRILDKSLNRNQDVINHQLNKLITSIEDAKTSLNKFPVQSEKGRIKLLDQEQIIAAYTKDRDICIRTYDNVYKINSTLCELEDKLSYPQFFRVHRSYLVNLEEVTEIIPWFKGKYRLIMNTESKLEIPVSRNKVKKLKEIMGL